MSDAITGYDCSFGITNGSGGYDLVAEVIAITPPSYSREAHDVSHMSSPDEFREYLAGMMDAGEVAVELNYVPAVADDLVAALEEGAQSYRITVKDVLTVTFTGICTAYEPGQLTIDDKATASATFKVSGKPVFAAVA